MYGKLTYDVKRKELKDIKFRCIIVSCPYFSWPLRVRREGSFSQVPTKWVISKSLFAFSRYLPKPERIIICRIKQNGFIVVRALQALLYVALCYSFKVPR